MTINGITRPQFVREESKYVCRICDGVLRDAMQTSCGHRLCKPCVEEFLSIQDPKPCPHGEDTCDEISIIKNKIFKDTCARREVIDLDVYCVYAQYGCQQHIKYRHLQEHIAECMFRPTKCPNHKYGCQVVASDEELKRHAANGCDYRREGCALCEQLVCFQQLDDHQRYYCAKAEVYCSYNCEENIMLREELAEHEKKCPNRQVECSYQTIGCSFRCTQQEMTEHYTTAAPQHIEMLTRHVKMIELEKSQLKHTVQDMSNENDLLKSQMTKLAQDKTDIDRISSTQSATIQQLEQTLATQQERMTLMENAMTFTARSDEVNQNAAQIIVIQESQSDLRQSVEELKNQITSHPNIPGVMNKEIKLVNQQLAIQDVRLAEAELRFQILETATYNGKMLWKINNVSRRKRDAETGKTLSLYSQPFYTSPNGYKMCARIYLNGDGMGKNTHMSLFFVVMRGEYDALLSWPFCQKVTMSLLDQVQGRNHITESFRPDVTSSSFKRPTSEMNVASGCPLFTPQSVMLSPTYYKDDTIFIKISVDTTNLIDP